MKKIIIVGAHMPLSAQIALKELKVEAETLIVSENNPFAPEPTMIIENTYLKTFEDIKVEDYKYFEKPRSKYHK